MAVAAPATSAAARLRELIMVHHFRAPVLVILDAPKRDHGPVRKQTQSCVEVLPVVVRHQNRNGIPASLEYFVTDQLVDACSLV